MQLFLAARDLRVQQGALLVGADLPRDVAPHRQDGADFAADVELGHDPHLEVALALHGCQTQLQVLLAAGAHDVAECHHERRAMGSGMSRSHAVRPSQPDGGMPMRRSPTWLT